ASLRMNSSALVGVGSSGKSPHKVAMLLAVMDLIENESVFKNEIYFNEVLKGAFSLRFSQLAGENDRNNPHLPFFHLKTSGFWHHKLKPGKASIYDKIESASQSQINETISFAFLDDELFELLNNHVVRELLKGALYRNITVQERSTILDVGNGWDWLECEFAVSDYFSMLNKELRGERYSKTKHRRELLEKLNNRTEGSVEFKRQNISAVLLELGQPYIAGYKPAFNYQQQLKNVVIAYMAGHQVDVEGILETAQQEVGVSQDLVVDWENVLDQEPPEHITKVAEIQRLYLARKSNYADREMRNRSLGEGGEKFVIEFEKYRMEKAGRHDLINEIRWSSKEEGDGLGFDIRSFIPERDEELFIEVKTTSSGKYQPFFISDNEVSFSKDRSDNYSLYRVYEFKREARIFVLPGAVDQHVNLEPKSYKASFNSGGVTP
ncbi:MAG TPA: DUF3883 domain-containing protein, partial [Pseudomonadales bacterium]|nr:DUF3883 domain-containing protein [Pseudomonadales bacterium]